MLSRRSIILYHARDIVSLRFEVTSDTWSIWSANVPCAKGFDRASQCPWTVGKPCVSTPALHKTSASRGSSVPTAHAADSAALHSIPLISPSVTPTRGATTDHAAGTHVQHPIAHALTSRPANRRACGVAGASWRTIRSSVESDGYNIGSNSDR